MYKYAKFSIMQKSKASKNSRKIIVNRNKEVKTSDRQSSISKLMALENVRKTKSTTSEKY